MRVLLASLFCLLAATSVVAQSDRGTITGTVSDQAHALIPAAAVSAKNTDTGALFETVTTGTGNFTIASLPAGPYDLTIDAAGFSKFVQKGIRVQVAQSARIDVSMQVGSTTDSVTVSADATLLRTESAEQTYNLSTSVINALPINFGARGGFGGGAGTIRSSYSFLQLAPGASISGVNSIRVNGAPNDSFTVRVEGQEATNTLSGQRSDQTAPSVESIEEVSVQSSNFAAEFGQVAGGLFNFTGKSGTNQFHGSAYDYLVNEVLDAGLPFTDNGKGGLLRPSDRKQDFGASMGGPVYVPKLYDGRDKTFFFINYEMFRFRRVATGSFTTVPTDAFRNGDFSGALTNRALGTDSIGRQILENTIYDPLTSRVVDGRVVRDPYSGNIIPRSLLDPIALKVQELIPRATNTARINNYAQIYNVRRLQDIPSIKVDHNFSSKSKASFYFSRFRTDHYVSPDGLPVPITQLRIDYNNSPTVRLNYDRSITPTLLLHAGVGFLRHFAPDQALAAILNYDAIAGLGLVGSAVTPSGFPRITGLTSSFGGMASAMGPANANKYYVEKPTSVLSVTLIRDNHTYKAGAEFRIESYTDRNTRGSQGNYGFGAVETGLPSTEGQNLGGGAIGFPYASFLLGRVNNANVVSPQDPQFRKNSWSLFVQDTWKLTRNLTLDYGLRWDYQGAADEIHQRFSEFSPTTVNPSAGGLKGAMIYEGDGPGRCNCSFTKAYKYAIGPRIGAAYKINSKTVLRAGWGLTFGDTSAFNFVSNTPVIGGGYNQLFFTTTSYGDPALQFSNGLRYNRADLFYTGTDPGIRPSTGQINSPPYWIDPNGGRPPRINQWNIGLQRTIVNDLLIEAAYVGNRGAWYQANNLIDLNALTPERIQSFGLNINTAADRTTLTSRMDSPAVQARGFRAPYSGFPLSLTVAQSLRPYPQFGAIPVRWAPLGNNWYDSLQAKATKRYSHGLVLTGAFTWQKELDTLGAVNDVMNRPTLKSVSANSQPFVFAVGFNYVTPRVGDNRLVRLASGGWTFGGILRYGSGLPILVPAAQNNLTALLFRGTFSNRVSGQPLFLKDLNCRCIDPNKDFVLNPKAWSDPAAGQWGTSAPYYSDYRYARRPDEQLSLGRIFNFREGISFQLRAEFFNVFNRTQLYNPDSTNALQTQSVNAAGVPTSGFGRVPTVGGANSNTGTVFSPPRSGQIVARFQW